MDYHSEEPMVRSSCKMLKINGNSQKDYIIYFCMALIYLGTVTVVHNEFIQKQVFELFNYVFSTRFSQFF